jgi:hypothetical protein
MATSAERTKGLRERERRGLRRFTVPVSEDDLRAIAKRGYEGAVTTDLDQQAQHRRASANGAPAPHQGCNSQDIPRCSCARRRSTRNNVTLWEWQTLVPGPAAQPPSSAD